MRKINQNILWCSKRIFLIIIVFYFSLLLVPAVAQDTNASFASLKHAVSFAERVECQRAIEKIYWQYRIWPKENPQPKPSFEQIMNEKDLQAKVEDTLRKTRALDYYWNKNITAEQLNEEMIRMAQHTKKPEMLRDLWNALNNDPHLIAECLARPLLADRNIRNSYDYDKRSHGKLKQSFDSWWKKNASQFLPTIDEPAYEYKLPQILFAECGVDRWMPTSLINVPEARSGHTAVWTGTEMIIWGGDNYPAGSDYLNTGGRYNPITDSWIATATTEAPEARSNHTAVWTGTEMIIWGGDYSNTGGRYNPITDSWIATTTTAAPKGRELHTAVWTGTEMIIWGGVHDHEPYFLDTGGKYNPISNSWIATTMNNAPEKRRYHSAVWTGTEMIIWGGEVGSHLDTGGRYSPGLNAWNPTSMTNAPDPRAIHTAVWTGVEMIIWGGYNGWDVYNNGSKYYPVLDSWIATTMIDAPEPRAVHTAVWTGTEMIIWGDGVGGLNTGGRYNPVTDTWIATTTNNAPDAPGDHTAVWTGTEMIIWGGYYSNAGGRYNPVTDSWIATSMINVPSQRAFHSALWTGTEMIIWGGCLVEAPFPCDFSTDTGGRYNPITDSWTTTSIINVPAKRGDHIAMWTGSEMIIWGGQNTYWALDSGGRYNPISDSWTATSAVNVPVRRGGHTAVWTGAEMIIWGGWWPDVNTGGRYIPATDSWTATNLYNAPYARAEHTAIWDGTEMIIWGGNYDEAYFNTGASYCIDDTYTLFSSKPLVDDSNSQNPNGIIEPDETVILIGMLSNTGNSATKTVTGAIDSNDPVTLLNPYALYPDLLPGESASCTSCYSINAPAGNRPSTHWDFVITESPTCVGCFPVFYDFTCHVGNSFIDVPPSHLFYSYIEKALHSGATSGCTSNAYCPSGIVQRQQMAKFICIAMNTIDPYSCYLHSNCSGTFADVPAGNPFCNYIEALFNASVVSGCDSHPLIYCPNASVQRQAMAKILCNAMNHIKPDSCSITTCTGIFSDVPASNTFCGYIEGLYNANVVSGCAASLYCPTNNVSRGQMAKFLVNAFGLSLQQELF